MTPNRLDGLQSIHDFVMQLAKEQGLAILLIARKNLPKKVASGALIRCAVTFETLLRDPSTFYRQMQQLHLDKGHLKKNKSARFEPVLT